MEVGGHEQKALSTARLFETDSGRQHTHKSIIGSALDHHDLPSFTHLPRTFCKVYALKCCAILSANITLGLTMLACVRQAARRAVPRSTIRTLSSISEHGENGNTDKVLSATLSAIGGMATGNKAAFQDIGQPSSSSLPSLQSLRPKNTENLMIIPPAEDPLLHYMSSLIMRDGKRSQANARISRMLLFIHTLTRAPPLPILREAIAAVSPVVKCMTLRKSIKVVQKPVALGERARTRFAIQWLLSASANRPERTIEERLAREVVAVLQGESSALGKKAEMHKMAMVNRCV